MRRVFLDRMTVWQRTQEVAGWWERYRPALIEEDKDFGGGGGWWFDADHPAWQAALAAKAEARLAAMDPAARAALEKQIGGCAGCGDSNPLVD